VQVYCRRHSLTKDTLDKRDTLLLSKSFSQSQWEDLVSVVNESGRSAIPKALELVYKYWTLKRQNYGKPLIPRLQYYAKEEVELEKAKKRLKQMESDYVKMVKVRQFMERIRILVDLSKKREILKDQHTEIMLKLASLKEVEMEQTKKMLKEKRKTRSSSKSSSPQSQEREQPSKRRMSSQGKNIRSAKRARKR